MAYIESAKCIVVQLREIICDPEANSGLIAGNKYDGARVYRHRDSLTAGTNNGLLHPGDGARELLIVNWFIVSALTDWVWVIRRRIMI